LGEARNGAGSTLQAAQQARSISCSLAVSSQVSSSSLCSRLNPLLLQPPSPTLPAPPCAVAQLPVLLHTGREVAQMQSVLRPYVTFAGGRFAAPPVPVAGTTSCRHRRTDASPPQQQCMGMAPHHLRHRSVAAFTCWPALFAGQPACRHRCLHPRLCILSAVARVGGWATRPPARNSACSAAIALERSRRRQCVQV
jgi:hypothetical protein